MDEITEVFTQYVALKRAAKKSCIAIAPFPPSVSTRIPKKQPPCWDDVRLDCAAGNPNDWSYHLPYDWSTRCLTPALPAQPRGIFHGKGGLKETRSQPSPRCLGFYWLAIYLAQHKDIGISEAARHPTPSPLQSHQSHTHVIRAIQSESFDPCHPPPPPLQVVTRSH